MKANFVELILKKGEPRRLMQGVKNNRRPKGALYGGNGSYVMPGTSSELLLYVKAENGQDFVFDISDRVLEETNRQKLTDKLYEQVKSKLSTATFNIECSNVYWNVSL